MFLNIAFSGNPKSEDSVWEVLRMPDVASHSELQILVHILLLHPTTQEGLERGGSQIGINFKNADGHSCTFRRYKIRK